jgi:hypothetical protein
MEPAVPFALLGQDADHRARLAVVLRGRRLEDHLIGPAVAQVLDPDLVARLSVGHEVAQALTVVDGLAVDGGEHVTGLQLARRRGVGRHRGHDDLRLDRDVQLVQGGDDGGVLAHHHGPHVVLADLLRRLVRREDQLARDDGDLVVEPAAQRPRQRQSLPDVDRGEVQLPVGREALAALDRDELLPADRAGRVERGAGVVGDVGHLRHGRGEGQSHREQAGEHQGQGAPGHRVSVGGGT